MIIESIRIISFGCLRDFESSFHESLNVIEGRNESGKSTLAAFIKYMLYGFGRKNSEQAISERRKYINWDTETAEGSMIVRVAGKRYRIDRQTRLTEVEGSVANYAETLAVVDLDTNRRLSNKIVPGEEFLGVPVEVFGNTAFIGQADVRLSEREMDNAIENLIFSGDERLNTARAALLVAADRELILSSAGEGLLADARLRRDDLKKKYAAARSQNDEILEREASLATAERNLTASLSELGETVALNEACKKNALIDKYELMHEQEDRSAEFAEKIDELRRASAFNSFCPSDTYSSDIKVARDNFYSASDELLGAVEKYDRVAAEEPISAEEKNLIAISGDRSGEELEREHRRAMSNRTLFGVVSGVFFGVLAALAALVAMAIPSGATVTAIVVACLMAVIFAAAVVTLVVAIKSAKLLRTMRSQLGAQSRAEMEAVILTITDATNKKLAHEKLAREVSDELIYARGRLDSTRGEIARILGLWGRHLPDDDTEIRAVTDEVIADADRFVEEETRLRMHKATCDGKVRELRYSLLGTDENRLRVEIPPELRAELVGFDYSDLDRKIDFIKKRNEALKLRSKQTSAAIAQLRISSEDIVEIGDRLAIAESEVEALERRYNALSMAHEAITTSDERLRAEIAPRLAEYSRELISVATDGKYSNLGVNSKLVMTFGEGDDSKHIDYFSSGTRDIAYLSLRMALVDLLYRESPPICFDEVFSHQDEKRADDLMSAVADIAEQGGQFFIFTCREREAILASAAIPDCTRIRLS